MTAVRSLVYYLVLFPMTVLFSIISILILPLNRRLRYYIVTRWSQFALWWLRLSCGLTANVRGLENIPATPSVIFCKHQSAWETIALQFIFPPHAQVVKRELLWVPFFGWGLASLNPIAIDRAAGAKALRQVLKAGKERLHSGWWVLLFPEGTRTTPGAPSQYATSGGALALRAGCDVVPVAHNAGVYWSRNALTKHSGVIELSIGPLIRTEGRSAAEITADAKTWIEAECANMPAVPS